MITYSVDAIAVLIGEVPKIHGRPDFDSLWGLKQYLITRLKKIENTDHPNNGHSGYLLPFITSHFLSSLFCAVT